MMTFPDFAVRPTSHIFLHDVAAANPTKLYYFLHVNGIGSCKDRVTSRSEFRRKCTCKIPSLNVVNNDEKANLWQR